MKRPISLLMILMMTTAPAGYSQAPLAAPAPADAARIGVAAGIQGGVGLSRAGLAGRVLESGESVFLGDEITTDEKGKLQLLLLDQTTFSIGPNSAITIDEFVYDPKTDAGKVTASVARGTFRFITGKIAHKKPENMKVNLPSGYIGVRGTMVMGRAEGERSLVVLTGPGEKNNTGDKQGALVVGNDVDGENQEVGIEKTGFGTVIEGPGAAPQDPFLVPDSEIDSMSDSLNPDAAGQDSEDDGDEDSGGGSASELSGQDQVDAGDDSMDIQDDGNLAESLGDEVDNASQDSADDTAALIEGISTLADLSTIESGFFHYLNSNVTLYDATGNSVGTYKIQYDIDFGNRTVGGDQSKIASNGTPSVGTFVFLLDEQDFDEALDGYAIFHYSDVALSTGSCSPSCTADVTVALLNEGGEAAVSAVHVFELDKNGTQFDGSGLMDRESGAAP